ncbi:benzoylformate decarboxylase [Reticulibacter mediterranei]|uniref:Benzoylformate decarboxylase n=1 Tax=Reticulibacter mediterranei TaxID=2778369 RepID=A0A8J3ILG2_9CHLR|nr:thiamine pyrophosphate-binding protein [Reticulibacter mediterranei]GHO97784.1 benzoylformate decarboxylase [Reticulibacter mediterranei]
MTDTALKKSVTAQEYARNIVFEFMQNLHIGYLFGVPGTNEIPIIDGTNVPSHHVKYIPCLHENIAMGAAMGYAQMSGRPGVVMVHVTPGIGHSLGNLFDAHKAHIPVVILCAQQHSQLVLQEPLLSSETVRVAEQYTKWAYEVRTPEELPLVLQRAFKLAKTAPAGPVFLSIPWDYTIQKVTLPELQDCRVTDISMRVMGDPQKVQEAAEVLAKAQNPLIVVGDGVGAANAWKPMQEFANMLGACVYSEGISTMMNFPNNDFHWRNELPGSQEDMQKIFKDVDVAFLCGFNAQAQVVTFNYEKGPLIPKTVKQVYLHNDAWEIGKNHFGEVAIFGDIQVTLPALTQAIKQNPNYKVQNVDQRNQRIKEGYNNLLGQIVGYMREIEEIVKTLSASPANQNGISTIKGAEVAQTLGKIQQPTPNEKPLPLVLVNEAISDTLFYKKWLHYQDPISYFCGVGGSLGFSMPASLGFQLAIEQLQEEAKACNTSVERRIVVNVVGDGSALFYPQTWWTTAKTRFIKGIEKPLPILYIIANNREYKTLVKGVEDLLQTNGFTPSGESWYLHLKEPQASFVGIAQQFGIPQECTALVQKREELEGALRKGLEAVQKGQPYVIEVLTNPQLDQKSKKASDILDTLDSYTAQEALL